jgi:hypothetical protein
MPLASEDKSYIRDLIHGVRDVQKQTNKLLEEIRDLLKSPPERISGRPAPDDFQRILAERLQARICTCGESKAPCPVHEPEPLPPGGPQGYGLD